MITRSRINKVDWYLFSEHLIWNWQIQILRTYILSIVSWYSVFMIMRTSASGHLPTSSKQICKIVSLTARDFRRGEETKNGTSSIENLIYFILLKEGFDIVIHIYIIYINMCIYTYTQMQFHNTLDNATGFNTFKNVSWKGISVY